MWFQQSSSPFARPEMTIYAIGFEHHDVSSVYLDD